MTETKVDIFGKCISPKQRQIKADLLTPETLQEWFKSVGISTMCKRTGISRGAYYRYVTGEVAIPKMLMVIKKLIEENKKLKGK